jgi:hypothetical protein
MVGYLSVMVDEKRADAVLDLVQKKVAKWNLQFVVPSLALSRSLY